MAMKITTNREVEAVPCTKVYLYLNGIKYTLSEDIEGHLVINKIDQNEESKDSISVHPRSGNEITIS